MTGEYDAIVYDLDGTLVRLDVDWDAVAVDAAAALAANGVDVDGLSLWEVLETAEERGYRDEVDAAIAAHEREGAETAERLRLAEEFPPGVPVAVCSLNAEEACRLALERHELASHVSVVVGRDTTSAYKPDPEPLLHAIDELDADPSTTLFVGDSERDRRAAERAGVDFAWASDHYSRAESEAEAESDPESSR